MNIPSILKRKDNFNYHRLIIRRVELTIWDFPSNGASVFLSNYLWNLSLIIYLKISSIEKEFEIKV